MASDVLRDPPDRIKARVRALSEAARRAYRHRERLGDNEAAAAAYTHAGDVYSARAIAITKEWTDR